MASPGVLSERLFDRLLDDSCPPEVIDRLGRADFSAGRSHRVDAWARHNERIHVAVIVLSKQHGFDAALDLAVQDWRDLLVAADLAHADWPQAIDDWFAGHGA